MANDNKLVNLADLKEAFNTLKTNASQSAAGLMSATDKTKLDGITPGATANVGTVTSVATGVGLTGGTITGSGTLKAKLRNETALTIDSAAATTTSGRVYPVAVDKTGYLAVNVPWANDNTTYSAGTGLSLSGTTFSNSGVIGVKGNSESSYRTGNVNITAANIGAAAGNTVIADSAAKTISTTSSTYNLTGLTTDHVVAVWRFSGGYSENNPPADITVTTVNGSYTIQASNLLDTGITMQPIFIKP